MEHGAHLGHCYDVGGDVSVAVHIDRFAVSLDPLAEFHAVDV